MTTASICTIGDEILIGQIIDTNSSHIATELQKAGIKVNKMVSFSDDRDDIAINLKRELGENDIVIVTGGLGPTKDDVTKSVLYELSGSRKYVENAAQLEIIHRILSSRGLDVLDINKAQASVPEHCEVIPNRLGTAPVMVCRFDKDRFGRGTALYSLPGVPYEAIGALDSVVDDIKAHFPLEEIYHKTVMTYSLAESALAEKIACWEDNLPEGMHLAYLPDTLKGVALRLSVYGNGSDPELPLSEKCEMQMQKLRDILGNIIYTETETSLEGAIGEVLRGSGKTISTAESCTGGLIASLISSVPGASGYYLGSVVSYSNSVKENVLGVPAEIIEKFGAVSSECVAKMAEGVRRITGSDFAVATSGIAGPSGGSDAKPVGTVWVGISSQNGTSTVKFYYRNDRKRNIERFAASALYTILNRIKCDLNSL